MTQGILTFDDLRKISRLGDKARRASVERWARLNDIRYKYDGRGGIWTTVEAMNAAIGVSTTGHATDAGMLSPDIIF